MTSDFLVNNPDKLIEVTNAPEPKAVVNALKCSRTACNNFAQGWIHQDLGGNYCERCAYIINRENPQTPPLMTKVSRLPSKPSLQPVTQELIDALSGKGHLTSACICNFGLDSGQPFGRLSSNLFSLYLRGWVRKMFSAEELDAAFGKGKALTALLRRVDPSAEVKCVYDAMTANDLEEQKG